jgi:hypothetical protein
MARVIKTAEQHIADQVNLDKRRTMEKRQFDNWLKERECLEDYRDIRDDFMSQVRNTNMSFETIHELGGPHIGTLRRWDLKLTDKPQFGKMVSVARICGITSITITKR